MEEDFLDWQIPEQKEGEINICENDGCSHKGFSCRLPDDEHTEYLCGLHAEEQGYCICCGTFIAGTGMEITHPGFCDNCFDEIRSECEEEDEDFWAEDNWDEDDDRDNPNDSRNL